MLSCKEYASAVASGELERAGLARRLAGAYHWLICKYCRSYVRQLKAIGSGARRLFRGRRDDSESLERVEEQLVERCRTAPPPDSDPEA